MKSKQLLLALLFFNTAAFGQMKASAPFEMERRRPVSFTHVPILLLRVNPTALLGYNNTYQFGVEIAPPIGKLSFAFDYGTGKGKNNFNKYVREVQSNNKNKEFRGEIKAYFSDWYPFYALDKKPFGRYYSLEYINGKYNRDFGVPIACANLPNTTNENPINKILKGTIEKTHVLHLKFGRHIHLHRHLFLDVYGGIGIGKSKIEGDGYEIVGEELYSPVADLGLLANKMYENPKTDRFFFSKTLGVRIVVPI